MAEEVTAILCSSLPVVIPFLYQRWRKRQHDSSRSNRRPTCQSSPNLTRLNTVAIPPRVLGRGFEWMDEGCNSSVALKSCWTANKTILPNADANWPYGVDIPSYSLAAAAPSKADEVTANETDIVVRKEVCVRTESGQDAGNNCMHAM